MGRDEIDRTSSLLTGGKIIISLYEWGEGEGLQTTLRGGRKNPMRHGLKLNVRKGKQGRATKNSLPGL